MAFLDYQPEEYLHLDNSEKYNHIRLSLTSFLQTLPTFVNSIQALSSDTFRVLVSADKIHLFTQAADGTYKAVLREGGKIVEHVDLVRISPDLWGTASNIIMMANMAIVAEKLQKIETGIKNIEQLLVNTLHGRVKGVINALETSLELSEPSERRAQGLSACRALIIEICALIGQLKSHISSMPEEQSWYNFTLLSRSDDLHTKQTNVSNDIYVIEYAMSVLLNAYSQLNEPKVARLGLENMIADLATVKLNDAYRKSRLVPYTEQSKISEAKIQQFQEKIMLMKTQLLCDDTSHYSSILIHLTAKELFV